MIKNIIKITIISLALISSLNAKEDKYFLSVSGGLSIMSVSQNNQVGSIDLGTKPDTKGLNLNFEVGYNYTPNTFATAGISYLKYSDVKLYNYLVSYNKRLKEMPYNTYIGLVGGISNIELTKSLMGGATPSDSSGRELAIGIQIGFEKKLDNDLIFFAQYQFLKAKHTTTLESSPARSELIRDNFSNISFGVRW